MKQIKLELNDTNIKQYSEIIGKIIINYRNKYDGVIINTQIFDSNEFIEYKSYNNKKILQKSPRLFVGYDSIIKNSIKFIATIKFKPKKSHDIKFRACMIEQHKEIGESIVWAKFS